MTRQNLFIIASIITCQLLQAQGADKYNDENRPYEFGFTIDGQQHRHEEKDKNGIIKGEYGFITADGVYHVTVYATDEQGRFKILSMKNIRYKDYKGLSGPPSGTRQGHSLPLATPQPGIASQKPPSVFAQTQKPAQEFETISIEPPANSCSHCSIPTTSTAAPQIIPPVNRINSASSLTNAPGQYNQLYEGNTQNTPPGNIPAINQRNSFTSFSEEQNGFIQNQNSYGENQAFGVAPKVLGQQNNYNVAQNGPLEPSASLKPIGYGGAPSITQEPNAPRQQIPSGGQQIALGGQQIGAGEQQITSVEGQLASNGQNFTPGGQQATTSGGQQYSPNGQQYSPNGQQYSPNVQQYSPNVQEYPPSVQQNAPSGQQVATDGQITPGGSQYSPNGQQVVAGGQQYSPVGQRITPNRQQNQGGGENFERTRSGKQYTGSANLPTPQNSAIGGSGVPQTNLKPIQKPMLAYAQMQIVNKNTDIHAKRPGEKEGLPPGLKEDDMLKLLYTFNYTLGFQAHFEEGYTNGEKRGYYYTTGRNGVRTRVDYVADENGFRPILSQEVFDALSDEVPKENTEKEQKYGLKGYEFKWLYFPPDSSSQ